MNQPLCFIDSNLWLYSLIPDPTQADDQRKREQAIALINPITPIVSTQVINEVCSVLQRKAKFQESQIRQLVQVFSDRCVIVELTSKTLINASDLRLRYGFSFGDGLIVASAIAADATLLYSEDMQDGLLVEQQLRIINPLNSL
jgi:predicted nucleic acid-binding protein